MGMYLLVYGRDVTIISAENTSFSMQSLSFSFKENGSRKNNEA